MLFQGNAIAQNGAAYLAHGIEHSPWIDVLVLSNNKIDDRGATAFSLAIPKAIQMRDAMACLQKPF